MLPLLLKLKDAAGLSGFTDMAHAFICTDQPVAREVQRLRCVPLWWGQQRSDIHSWADDGVGGTLTGQLCPWP